MVNILIKSDAGIFEPRQMGKKELVDWFKANTDTEGNVQQEIVIYGDAVIKANTDGTYDWVMSDGSVDRDLERIDPAGWDLKEFKKNPVVLWAHDSTIPAIGKVLSPKVKDSKLVGKVQFSSKDIDPFAGMIEGKVKEGIISAGSVGFMSKKIEIIDDKDKPEWLIHREQALYEFSIVNIPANINARVEMSAEPEEEKGLVSILGFVVNTMTDMEKLLDQPKKSYIEELFKDRHETSDEKPLDDLFSNN